MSHHTWKPTLETVRRILWLDWDPIGVNDHPDAVDEYDSYAPGIVSMLARGCSADELDLHLSRIETDSMGLSQTPGASRATVVQKLLTLQSMLE
jgi:hypothetical protein